MSKRCKRPMARVRQVGLFSREIKERLSLAAVELLLSLAAKLSEGQVVGGGRHFYGSTMFTIDLEQATAHLSDSCDVTSSARLVRLMSGSDAILDRIRAVALDEAVRLAGAELDGCEIDVRARAEGCVVYIDADVEARLSSAAGEGG